MRLSSWLTARSSIPALLPRCGLAMLVAAMLLCSATPAHAETIRLRSGSALDIDQHEFEDTRLRVRARVDGGTASFALPYERIRTASLLALIDGRFDAKDVDAQLRAAAILGHAATHGPLRDDAAALEAAAARYERVLVLDESKGPVVVAAIEALAARHGARYLAPIEAMVRKGEAGDALVRMAELRDLPVYPYFDVAGRLKLRVLEKLAQKQVVEAPASPQKTMGHGDRSRFRRAQLELERAAEDRDDAIDATMSQTRARSALRRAERHIQRARQLLGQIDSGDPTLVQGQRDLADGLLIRNALDLADLLRSERRYADAAQRVRTVLLLAPDNQEARALQQRIEAERLPPAPPEAPSRELILDGLYTPYYSPTYGYLLPGRYPGFGHRYPYGYRGGSRVVIRRGGFGFWLRGHYGAGQRGGSRVVGRRR